MEIKNNQAPKTLIRFEAQLTTISTQPHSLQQLPHRPLHHLLHILHPRTPPNYTPPWMLHLCSLHFLLPLLQPPPPPGLLWAAQGPIITSYSPTIVEGTYIYIFWTIFNMGGVIGGLIPFNLNYHRTEAASVNDGNNVAFMCFMSLGTLLSLAILPACKVARDDGSRCTSMLYSNVSTECVEVLKLFFNWNVLLLVPAAWSSNFVYPYQFNDVNGVLFNLRTRGLNSACYWGEEKGVRGLVGVVVVAVLGSVIWGSALANQLKSWIFKHSGSHFYWVIGALADDSEILTRYSAGAAVAWQVDEHKVSFMSQLIVNWVLATISYPLLFVLVMSVKDA
uniref:UNC93-like protein C922.05c family n=1 Tax=Cajanus cajan TaxID=3821 RepID=A0A151U0F6_CAJCA|nr:UNC93-like protein C922.05c family [Cajanus cajan]